LKGFQSLVSQNLLQSISILSNPYGLKITEQALRCCDALVVLIQLHPWVTFAWTGHVCLAQGLFRLAIVVTVLVSNAEDRLRSFSTFCSHDCLYFFLWGFS
jgi:hypothetical protein